MAKKTSLQRTIKNLQFGWAPHPFRSAKKGQSLCKVCLKTRQDNDMHTNRDVPVSTQQVTQPV